MKRPLILVPYRDRESHLAIFLPYMRRVLPEADIWIMEQTADGRRFNRGALLNAGVALGMQEGYTHFIFHDVDLLPRAALRKYYLEFPRQPIHIGWAWTDKYNYARFFGGIVSMSARDLRRTGGFPNDMWGWGGEDDALRDRIHRSGLDVLRPIERGPDFMRSLAHKHASGPDVNPNKYVRDKGRFDTLKFHVVSVRQRKNSVIRYYTIQL